MSYKPRSLFRLIQEINQSLFLPHIQRPFVWDEEQMLFLFDSLMRNYPVQSFLLWRTCDQIKARRFMEQVTWGGDLSSLYQSDISAEGREKVFVLDGQQRIQTLYAIFSGAITNLQEERAEAYFDLTSGAQPGYQGIKYLLQFSDYPLPLPWYRVANLLGRDSQKTAEELADTINDALDEQRAEASPTAIRERSRLVRRNLAQLISLLREEKYFWIQELDGVASHYSYQQVLEIFVRVNSGGTKLDSSDLMFAAMKEGWDDIEEAIEQTTALLSGQNLHFDKVFPLKCLLVAHNRGAETANDKFTGPEGEQLLQTMGDTWDRAEQAFRQLRDFLHNDLKLGSDRVIRSHNSLVPLFDYLFHNPKPSELDRVWMRAYHYKAQIFGWYSQGTDAVINALHTIVGKTLPGGFPLQLVTEYFQRRGQQIHLHREDLHKSRLRTLLLNLVCVHQQGHSPFDVLLKDNEPQVDHIYPRSPLKTRLGLERVDIDHLGNFRLVGALDNIRKRAELPASYFTRLKQAGVDIGRYLLLDDLAQDPGKLHFDVPGYLQFRDRRLEKIWEIVSSIVDPEQSSRLYQP